MIRHFFSLCSLTLIIAGFAEAAPCMNENKPIAANTFTADSIPSNIKNKQPATEVAWDAFWKNFVAAIHAKDKEKIAALTAADFYDGGGGTVQYWLQSEVFLNDKTFTAYKNTFSKGVKKFKGYEGNPYKATGKNKSGDLFFEYKKGHWLFGGVVGD